MRIAIVGAGISGLATAHLLHQRARDHRVRGRRGWPAGTRTPSAWTPRTPRITWTPGSSSSTIATTPTSSGCWLRCGVAVAAVGHELRRLRRRRLRVQRVLAERAVRQTRAPGRRRGSTAWSPTSCASTRNARELLATAAKARRWATGSTRGGYSRAFVERLIVPQASAVWSADPRQMWTFPARFLVEFFANHGMLGFAKRPQWRTVVGGSRTLRRRASTQPVRATGCALNTPITAIARDADGVTRHPARRRARALRRGRARHPLRPGAAACSATRPTASTRSSARSRTSPTRRCCTPTARCCRGAGARGRAGTTTCSPEPTGMTTVTYHMNRLQALDADREFCVTLNRSEAIDPGEGAAHDLLRAPGLHPRRRPRAGPPPRDQRPPTARTTPARTGTGASTRTASPARSASRERFGARL